MAATPSTSTSTSASAPPTSTSNPDSLSPLEQDILDEYTHLLSNMNKRQQLSNSLSSLANTPTAEILDGLRMLERKTSLVFTLLKASVYSIVLQQEVYGGGGGAGSGEGVE
ncbi:hypothetical protein MMC16_002798 [Acarospora aff. strigata]|nr:hypothetical protein [Acarospora aff. strigata]